MKQNIIIDEIECINNEFTDVNGKKQIIKGQVVISQSDGKQSFQCRLIDETGRIIDVNYIH